MWGRASARAPTGRSSGASTRSHYCAEIKQISGELRLLDGVAILCRRRDVVPVAASARWR